MATISITVPDGVVDRVADAFVALYPAEPTTIDTAAKRRAYVKSVIVRQIKETVRAHESTVAAQAAAAKADNEIAPS